MSLVTTDTIINATPRRWPWQKTPLSPDEHAMKQIEQQNTGMISAAHRFATALVVTASVASLVTLAGDLVQRMVHQYQTSGTVSIPAVASLMVSFILVLAMDTGMLIAALYLKSITERGLSVSKRQHQIILVLVGTLESVTYAVMIFTYEPLPFANNTPSLKNITIATVVIAVLIIIRAGAVPFLSVYLATARVISIGLEDIGGLGKVILGQGTLKKMREAAVDPTLNMADSLKLLDALEGAGSMHEKVLKFSAIYENIKGPTNTAALVKQSDLSATLETMIHGALAERDAILDEIRITLDQNVALVDEKLAQVHRVIAAMKDKPATPLKKKKATSPVRSGPELSAEERIDAIVNQMQETGNVPTMASIQETYTVGHGTAQSDLRTAKEKVKAMKQAPAPVSPPMADSEAVEVITATQEIVA